MSRHWMSLTLCSCLAILGCDSSEDGTTYEDAPLSEKHEHDHAHEGAHGGQVIEFDAAHAHHAELVFSEESRDITLYFYGAEIGEAHAAEGLVFELEQGDEEEHLDVTASPLEGETEETASRYVVAGADVPDYVKSADDLHGHFHVTLDGTDFRGSFGEDHHDHDHGEEGHDDHDEHHDDHEDGEHEEGDDHDEAAAE